MKRQEFLKNCKEIVVEHFNSELARTGKDKITTSDIDVALYGEEPKSKKATLIINTDERVCYTVIFDGYENKYQGFVCQKWHEYGMSAIRIEFKNAILIEKWKVRHMKRKGEKIIFLGYYMENRKKYAVYIYENRYYATESKK